MMAVRLILTRQKVPQYSTCIVSCLNMIRFTYWNDLQMKDVSWRIFNPEVYVLLSYNTFFVSYRVKYVTVPDWRLRAKRVLWLASFENVNAAYKCRGWPEGKWRHQEPILEAPTQLDWTMSHICWFPSRSSTWPRGQHVQTPAHETKRDQYTEGITSGSQRTYHTVTENTSLHQT